MFDSDSASYSNSDICLILIEPVARRALFFPNERSSGSEKVKYAEGNFGMPRPDYLKKVQAFTSKRIREFRGYL